MQFGGTSSGSVVAALFAMGYSHKEMLQLFKYFSKAVMGIGPRYIFANIKEEGGLKFRGMISGKNMEEAFKEAGNLKNVKKITDIKMPIAIPATDLITNSEVVFTNNESLNDEKYIHDIEIGKAVRASSSFPGIYSPFEYKGRQFVDGGVFDNLPVREVKKMGVDKVLSIKFDLKPERKNNTAYNIIMQCVDVMGENLIRRRN